MKTFTTPKGTVLPLLELQGKPYLQPAHRLIWFREERPDWRILSSVSMFGDSFVKAEVTILDPNGDEISRANSVYSFAENAAEGAETGAMGRALAWLGFGTQFTGEDAPPSRAIVDAPISRPAPQKPRNFAPLAPSQAPPQAEGGPYVVDFGKHQGSTLEQISRPVAQNFREWLIKNSPPGSLNPKAARFIREVEMAWPEPKLPDDELPF